MSDTLLPDDPQTLKRLDSVACLFEWMRSMPAPARRRTWFALAECSEAIQQVVVDLLSVVRDPCTTPDERQQALMTIADSLFRNANVGRECGLDSATSVTLAVASNASTPCEIERMDSQEASFSQRLRELLESKRVSQSELADRVGCSQPAISQMLNRNCRPQKKTILKLAEALNVRASDLWPDIEVAEMLDAVASFQQDHYVMTEAEARALCDTSQPNRPKIEAKSLPTRNRL